MVRKLGVLGAPLLLAVAVTSLSNTQARADDGVPAAPPISNSSPPATDPSTGTSVPFAVDPGWPSSGTVAAAPSSSPGGSTLLAAAGIECTNSYDYPHPATSSGKTTINAHLSVSCTGPVAQIFISSQMCHANLDRCGETDTTEVSNKAKASTGADMTCGPDVRSYKAFGSVVVTFGLTTIRRRSPTHTRA